MRERLRDQIAQASEPIAPFWPMRRFAKRNPLQGLEHLPFDRAVREAKHLLGGNGYLSNGEYRRFYREGRITEKNVREAIERVGPRLDAQSFVQAGARRIDAADVLRLQLLFGFEALDPVLLSWTLGPADATRRFQHDLPAESKRRILEMAGAHEEESYVTNLWDSTLSALRLPDAFDRDAHDHHQAPHAAEDVALPAQRTVGDWLDVLADASIVEQINGQMTKWTAAFVDEGIAGWSMPGREAGFYQAWRSLRSGTWAVASSVSGTSRKKCVTCPIWRKTPLPTAFIGSEYPRIAGQNTCRGTWLSCQAGRASFAGWVKTPITLASRGT